MIKKIVLLFFLIIFCLGLVKCSYGQGQGIRAQDLNIRTDMENFYKIITIDPNTSPSSQIVKNITFENFYKAFLADLTTSTAVTNGKYLYYLEDPNTYPFLKKIDYVNFINSNQNNIYFPDPKETNQGVAGNGRTINAYIDALSSKSATIILKHTDPNNDTEYLLETNETIPSNITLKIEPGAYIDGNATLTINGPFEAGICKCFDPNANVSFGNGSIEKAYPQWFGATGDGTTDDSISIRATIGSLQTGNIIFFPPGTYIVSEDGANDYCIFSNGINIEGTTSNISPNASIIKLADSQNCHIWKFNGTNISMKNIAFNGNSANQDPNGDNSSGLWLDNSYYVKLEKIGAYNFKDYGFYIYDPESLGPNVVNFDTCYASNCSGGYYVDGDAIAINFTNCGAQTISDYGWYLAGAEGTLIGCWNEACSGTYYYISGVDYVFLSPRLSGSTSASYMFRIPGQRNTIITPRLGATNVTNKIYIEGSAKKNTIIYPHAALDPTVGTDWTDGPALSNLVQNNFEKHHKLRDFPISDTTPSVEKGRLFRVDNDPNDTIITDFDDGYVHQIIKVISNDPNSHTTFDFTASNLKGNGNVDWTPEQYDWMECVYDGSKWYCDVVDCSS